MDITEIPFNIILAPELCGLINLSCIIYYFTLSSEQSNSAECKICVKCVGPKREEFICGWRRLHNE